MRAFLSVLMGVLMAAFVLVCIVALWYAAVFLGAIFAGSFIAWVIIMAAWDIFTDGDKKKPP